MVDRLRTIVLLLVAIVMVPGVSFGDPASFVVNTNSRVSLKTEAPLETIIGTVATPSGTPLEHRAVTGTIAVDLAKPQEAKGLIKVVLNAVRTGVDRRDTHMRSADFLDSEENDVNRYAGTIAHIELAPEQAEAQKRFGFTADNLRVKTKFSTRFTNHDMKVPRLLILKLSDDIEVETDLILVKAQ